MARDLEKDLMEIETATKNQLKRDNMFTASVLQRCYKLVSELKGYKELEEQGKLLKLPCAVGDTIYRINKGAEHPIIPLQVMNFKIFNNDLVESFKMECVDEWDGAYAYRKTDIGRSVFLTKESAGEEIWKMEHQEDGR